MSLLLQKSAGEQFGTVLRTRTAGDFLLRLSRYGPGLRIPSHHHPVPYFCLVIGGGILEARAGREECFEPASVHFHPAAEPHGGRTSPGGATCLSVVPRGDLSEWVSDQYQRAPRRFPPQALAGLGARCHRAFHEADDASSLSIESAALDLVAGWFRLEHGLQERRRPRWLDGIEEYLRAHYAERILLRDLARLAGVHRVYLLRAFRRATGLTPGAYVRRLRIDAARVALAGSSRAVAEIALESGFSSQAHFTRAFHREVGLPPAAFRRAHGRRG